jgi:hypothetical protein
MRLSRINTSLTHTYQAVACSEVQTNRTKKNQDGDDARRIPSRVHLMVDDLTLSSAKCGCIHVRE